MAYSSPFHSKNVGPFVDNAVNSPKSLSDKPSELSTENVGPFVDTAINSPKASANQAFEENVDLLAPSNHLQQQNPTSVHPQD